MSYWALFQALLANGQAYLPDQAKKTPKATFFAKKLFRMLSLDNAQTHLLLTLMQNNHTKRFSMGDILRCVLIDHNYGR